MVKRVCREKLTVLCLKLFYKKPNENLDSNHNFISMEYLFDNKPKNGLFSVRFSKYLHWQRQLWYMFCKTSSLDEL